MSHTPRTINLAEVNLSWGENVLTGNRLVQDSRKVSTGDVFVAMGSTGTSGHDFAGAALNAGATSVIVDLNFLSETQELVAQLGQNPELVVGIPHLFDAVPTLSDAFWGSPSAELTIVGVTGTNGKTSVVQLICQAWNLLGIRSASIGTLGVGIYGQRLVSTGLTTPPVTLVHEMLAGFVEAGVTHVGIEVSSHALEQNRVGAVSFDQVVFTNITRDHLDFHGTMEKYAAAKERIFDLPGSPTAVVNLDDEFGATLAKKYSPALDVVGVTSLGNPSAILSATEIELSAVGLTFTLTKQGKSQPVTCPLVGRFNIDNLLSVAGVLSAEGFETDRISGIFSQLKPVFGRMNRIQPTPDSPLVIVDYAHTPDALEQALNALQDYNFSRIITVFGCTGDRDAGKRPEMARIAEERSTLVIVTDDDVHHENGDKIVDDIRGGFTHPENVIELRDRGQALRHAITEATTGDVVFIAGKGHEEHLVIENELVPFSDTDVALELLQLKANNVL